MGNAENVLKRIGRKRGHRVKVYKSAFVIGRDRVRAPRSVTRFGKILPLWQIFDSLFHIWQNAEPTLANL